MNAQHIKEVIDNIENAGFEKLRALHAAQTELTQARSVLETAEANHAAAEKAYAAFGKFPEIVVESVDEPTLEIRKLKMRIVAKARDALFKFVHKLDPDVGFHFVESLQSLCTVIDITLPAHNNPLERDVMVILTSHQPTHRAWVPVKSSNGSGQVFVTEWTGQGQVESALQYWCKNQVAGPKQNPLLWPKIA